MTPDHPLPTLREELTLHPGAPTAEGAPTWTLHDPARQRYFSIGRIEFELLRRWLRAEGLDAAALASRTGAETGVDIDVDRVARLRDFLHREQLLRLDAATLQEFAARARRSPWSRLLHGYLFFRIPLWHPDRFLGRTLPRLKWVFTPAFPLALGLVALMGLYLVSRQWDSFLATFPYFFTLGGAIVLALTLTGAKLVHELGHAYTAKHFEVRVSTLGVAFMVLWPVLYTDISDAWRLTSRRQRLLIGAAGVLAELALAAAATLLWAFLPDGPARSAAFVLATASWLMSLLVNLNPLMRFDGYYLLSDLLGLPNLQDRAFRFGRWRLREALFGLGDPPPEGVSPHRRRILLGYAYATWIYRALLFLGIALVVYHLFFKVLGIFLMGVEIVWFIALPIYREADEWRRRGGEMGWNPRTRRNTLVAGLVLLALIIPWRTTLEIPAVHRAAAFQAIFPPSPAMLVESQAMPGKQVAQGEILFRFIDPEIGQELERQRREARFAALELSRQAGDPERLEQRLVLEERLEKARCEIRRQQARQDQLVVKAPFDGRVQTTAEGMTPGRWVETREELAYLVAPGKSEVVAYLDEAEIESVKPGDKGSFYPEDPALGPVAVVLKEIDPAPVQQLGRNDLYVASPHGGGVAANRAADGQLTAESAIYRLRLELEEAPLAANQAVRGALALKVGSGTGILQRWLQQAWAVLIRESGF